MRHGSASNGRDAGRAKKTLAVWKFSSCDGCQLSLLDCEDELLAVAASIDIAYFLEATSASVEGPYDVSLVEGSVTTPHEIERAGEIRAASRSLITIGACATSGGVQALRNFADVEEFMRDAFPRSDGRPDRVRAGRWRTHASS
jgi:sulfhydrogenase subunit delta